MESSSDDEIVEADSSKKPDKENYDPCFEPMLESALKGYSVERLFNIIVGKDVPTGKLCNHVPRGVRKHAAFVVDTTSMASSDIISYGDDNGSWTGHSKPRRMYKIEICEITDALLIEEYQPESSGNVQEIPSNVYTLRRNYFRHAHTPEFRKMIATILNYKGDVLPFAVVQYYFQGGIKVPVKLAKHGNAKKDNATPYMRTSRPVMQKLKQKCSQGSCRKAVEECFEDGGGTSGISSLADVPRDRKQAYNLKQQTAKGTPSDKAAQRHEFYDVLELLNKGTFVRDFSFTKSVSNRTQPRSFQATGFQLGQLSRMCVSEVWFSPRGGCYL